MKKYADVFWLLLIYVLMTTSCSVQKRVYRKGYHVVWDQKKGNEESKPRQIAPKKSSLIMNEVPEAVTVSGNVRNTEEFISIKKKSAIVIGKDTCGDVLLFKNGDKLIAKVIEVDKDKIKYKRCDNLDGPVFSTRKGSLAKLTYYNGVEEDLDIPEEIKPTKEQAGEKPKETNSLGLMSFIFACLGVFFGITLPLAVAFGFASLAQFKKYPERYKDKWMPRAGLGVTLGIAFILFLIFLNTYIYTGFLLGFAVFFGALAFFALIGLLLYA
jgi:hypothetical protein